VYKKKKNIESVEYLDLLETKEICIDHSF